MIKNLHRINQISRLIKTIENGQRKMKKEMSMSMMTMIMMTMIIMTMTITMTMISMMMITKSKMLEKKTILNKEMIEMIENGQKKQTKMIKKEETETKNGNGEVKKEISMM